MAVSLAEWAIAMVGVLNPSFAVGGAGVVVVLLVVVEMCGESVVSEDDVIVVRRGERVRGGLDARVVV